MLHFESPEKMESNQCILSDFIFSENKIELHFVNGSSAFLRSKNIEGDMALLLVARKLGEFTGKSYKDILEADF